MPEYRHQNFAQAVPNTPIHEGQTGNRYVSCNLLNCRVPDDAVVERCQIGQQLIWTEEVTVDVGGETVTMEERQQAPVGVGVKGEVTQEEVDAVAAENGLEAI